MHVTAVLVATSVLQLNNLTDTLNRIFAVLLLGLAVVTLFRHRDNPGGAFKTFGVALICLLLAGIALAPGLATTLEHGLATLAS